MTNIWINLAYLVTSVLFILGIRRLRSPETARSGNQLAAVGMLIAVVATLLSGGIGNWWVIALGVIVGGAVGVLAARAVAMTAMPQMVALFNGMGGGAAAVVSSSDFLEQINRGTVPDVGTLITMLLGALIGAITLAGSLIAFGKLQGLVTGRAFRYGGQQFVNLALVAVAVVFSLLVLLVSPAPAIFVVVPLVGLALGVALVMPIGGADMPVIISLLNSMVGLAAAITGFVLGNNALIISGALVGASGTILTQLMSKAMNRSLSNILFGAFGAAPATVAAGPATGPAGATVREISAEDAAILMEYSRQVIIVPGYGMAVAQAQHAVRELADLLESRGVTVKFAIHPVAGRMPGHMNVLLAEANVPYDKLYDMEAINSEFARTDVALVIGANDVTNPAARNTPGSPIYGMPILNVDQAQNIIVIKRSLKPGFAGIDNELYYDPKCRLLFGDAKEAVERLIAELKTGAAMAA